MKTLKEVSYVKVLRARYKVASLQQIEEGKLKASQAAKDQGVAEQTIYNWIKELCADPKAELPGSGHPKPDVEYQKKLEKENSEPYFMRSDRQQILLAAELTKDILESRFYHKQ